jgi:hypothetical protein
MDRVIYKALSINTPIQNRKNVYHATAMAACLVLIISAAVILPSIDKNTGTPGHVNPVQTIDNSTDGTGLISSSLNSASVSLHINELAKEPSFDSYGICLLADDFVPMTYDESVDYYGVSIPIEEILPNLKRQEQNYGIYKDKSRGVYYDINAFSFFSEDSSQKLTVALRKGRKPYSSFNEAYNHELKQSKVNGVDMIIAHYTNDFDDVGVDEYYAEFMFNGNGYSIYAKNTSKEDFVKVLSALVA